MSKILYGLDPQEYEHPLDREALNALQKVSGIQAIFQKFQGSTIEKEMKMPMLFDTKEQAEKEAYKFGCEGAHQMGDKWMPCSMHKDNH